jgi:ribosomal protein S8
MVHFTSCLNSLKVGVKKKNLTVTVFLTKMNLLLLWALYKHGYIVGYCISKDRTKIIVYLRYLDGFSALETIKQISKISKRIYVSAKNFKDLKGSVSIVSTNKGILISNSCINKRVGGELLFKLI